MSETFDLSETISETVNVSVMGREPAAVSKKTTLFELSKGYRHLFGHPIILASVDHEMNELHNTLYTDCAVEFMDITNPHGYRAYQRSAVFLMIYAAKEVLGKRTRVIVEHSINKNYYCEIPGVEITEALLAGIESKMREAVCADMPIKKYSLPVEESVRLAKEFGLKDKVDVMRYRKTANVNFYKLDWFYDYFYGPMVPGTGYLTMFKLHRTGGGFMLQFPSAVNPNEFSELKSLKNVSQVFQESNQWAKILEVDTAGALNNAICRSGFGDIIRISEALHEKKIGAIADSICEQKKSLVLIAGPSSSGKTTFAQRLSIQLRVNGMRPSVISLDDYYVNRDETPLDEFGQPNFECLEAIDVRKLNEDLTKLLNGETVPIPSFNFVKGEREHLGRRLQLGRDDILILEGIHGLNEMLTGQIPKKDKFKVFISALTQINIDDHNHVSTTDTRLIRRVVRDSRFRGFSAVSTIAMWPSVLRGENKNIFPFQEEADAFFNSALVYEMCILKQYAESVLFQVGKERPEYTESKRLIKFLDTFLGVNSEQVPTNSILREFIGGSCFGA